MVVIYPLNTRFKQVAFVRKIVVNTSASVISLVICIAMYTKLFTRYIGNDLCLPFVDQTKSVLQTKILVWLISVVQTIEPFIITIIHIVIFKTKKESGEKIRKSKPVHESNASLIIRLALSSISNFLCWFPVNGVYISAMFLPTYSYDMIIWSTLLGLSFNPIMMPSIFIIISVKNILKKRK